MSVWVRSAAGRRALFGLAAVVAAIVLGAQPLSASASGSSSQTVGAAPAVPQGAVSLGATPSSQSVKFDLVLSPRDPAGLKAFALAVSTPGSPEHGHFLSVGEFAARFGQSAAAIQGAEAALRSIGLRPGAVTANHLVIPVATTVGQAERSLQTGFASYRLSSGQTYSANTSAPRLPSSLAAITTAVVGLNSMPDPNVGPLPGQRSGRAGAGAPQVSATGPQPCTAATSAAPSWDAYTYNQLAQAYEINDLYTDGDEGKGVNVGLFELDPYKPGDIAAFQKCYGTDVPVKLVKVDGGAGTGAGLSESTLDIETVIATAPLADVTVYDASPDNYATGVVNVYTDMFDADTVQIASASYGLCEPVVTSDLPGLINSEETLFEQAAVEGISVFTAAGDTGSEGCERANGSTALATLDQGSDPWVTSVGGTHLSSVGPPPSESVWNETALGEGAGGGGISSVWEMPGWQLADPPGVINAYSSGAPCGLGTLPGLYCREVPDVSADADPSGGYEIYWSGTFGNGVKCGGWCGIGGTSAATPLWAAMTADIISAVSDDRAGFLDPLLYKAAADNPTGNGVFNDITTGNNDYGDLHGGAYPATAYYDMASGLGTPIAPGLLKFIKPTLKPIGFTDSPGQGAPPAYLGLDKMTAVPATCTVGTSYTSFSTPLGNVKLGPSSKCEQVGDGWSSWVNGYTGYVYWDDKKPGATNTLTLTLPPDTNAFYFYADPDGSGLWGVSATSGSTKSGEVNVLGPNRAQYFGFYGQTKTTYITTITITTSGDDFAIGDFGIAS